MIAQHLHGLISSLDHDAGVWPYMLPQQHSGFPAITFSVDEDMQDQILDGVGSLRMARVSIDCWDRSYLAVNELADSICDDLVPYRGLVGTYTVDHIRKERQLDLYEADTGLFRVSLQFFIAYRS